uniref:Uncharacterized protein n=1 Tax=Oryza meridionalis TaxID=40149 RepID=A0A0E0CEF1_9ORYZ
MVVLVESPGGGVTLKRKGGEEPELFICPGDVDGGFPLACRATKMRRLVRDDDAPQAAAAEDDVAMGEAPSAAVGEGAMVVYEPADSVGGIGLLGQLRRRLRPWASLRAGAEWIRDMLREADSRTVRRLLSGAEEEEDGAGMALVPWGSAPAAAGDSMVEDTVGVSSSPSSSSEEDGEGSAAAMEVEEEAAHLAGAGAAAGCGEGYLFRRWPQHCMPPPPQQLPAIGQASPVMWSW